mgnify:CR=1 FL=1
MNFQELLIKRRSCRKFTEQAVEQEKIDTLMTSVLMSPSSKRCNPWEFIVVTDKDKIQALSVCKDNGATFVAGAPLAIIVMADQTKTDVWVEDTSIASILLQLQAEDLGLGSCWVQIRNRHQADGTPAETVVRKMFNIPENMAVESIIAIGYRNGEAKSFDPARLQKEKLHFNDYQTEYKL